MAGRKCKLRLSPVPAASPACWGCCWPEPLAVFVHFGTCCVPVWALLYEIWVCVGGSCELPEMRRLWVWQPAAIRVTEPACGGSSLLPPYDPGAGRNPEALQAPACCLAGQRWGCLDGSNTCTALCGKKCSNAVY